MLRSWIGGKNYSMADISLRQGARGSRLKTNSDPVIPNFQLRASSFQPFPCEHLQKPHNAGSWPQARFFNTLIAAFKDCAPSLACLPPGLLENRIGKEQ
jgi:hypothetical protein